MDQKSDHKPTPVSRRRFLHLAGLGIAGTSLLAACTPAAPAAPTVKPAVPAAKPTAAKPAAPAAQPTAKPAAPAAKPTAAKPAAAAPTQAPAAKPAAAKPAAGEPQRGGTLMFGNSKDLSNPHPFIDVSSVPQYMKENIWESLLAVDLESEIHGMLAERWETSPDGKTWTFHLRPNVKFHDGKDLTAEDVVFSAGWVMNEENQAFGAAAMENVQDVTAVDPRTIRMTLKAQSAAFLSQISSIRAFSVVPSGSVPNGVTRIEGAPPPGTGPFKWESWQPNNEFRVTRFDGYWEGAPYLERVVFKLIPDDTARFNALRAGDLQAAERVGVQFARQILEGRITGISTYPARLSGFRRLVFNHRGDFFHDIRMREAVAYALDKEALLEEVYFGFATPAEIKMPPGSVWERAANLQPRLRDLDRSRRLLQEAGYNGQPIRGNGRRGSEHTNVWEAVTRQLAEVGINLDVEITESAVYEERQNSGQFDITLRGGNTDDDPSESLKPDYYSEPGPMRFANYSGHSNPELDRLFDLMEVQTNREERIETFKKLAKLMHDEIIDIPLGFAGDRFFATLDARVRNFSPTDGGGYTHRFGGLKKTWLVG